ncbi:MAG TPA: glycoside hydrolase family 5 protein [Candidatus Saccharimonadales bacterium]|jgi:glucan 1,3-beta-glucosidase
MSWLDLLWWNKPKDMKSPAEPLRGVNLGGWLVLEKWITPSLFKGLSAVDEYTLCSTGGPAIQSGLRAHRDSFVTLRDFELLKQHGIDAVRLPVGYWTFGDEPPYSSTISYVDKAFEWARQTGIVILLDLHAAPGSQNGWDHSGRAGACTWADDEQNVVRTLAVVAKLVKRYGQHPSLLGIELLNEPKWTLPRKKLLRYYETAYRIVRKECPPECWIVFHDSFRPRRWKHKLPKATFPNAYIDTHQYQTFNARDKRLDMAGHMRKTFGKVRRDLARMNRSHPVVVGEWSVTLDPQSLQGLNRSQRDAASRAYGAAQLIAYGSCAAWFYWTYRTEDGGVWSFRDCVDRGWLPNFADLQS